MNRSSKILRPALTLLALGLLTALVSGCSKKEGDTASGAAASPTAGGSGTAAGSGATPVPGTLPAGEGALDPAKLPAVVAEVDGAKITKDELVRGAQTAQGKAARMGQQLALTADFYKQVLDEMIADRLLQQDAKAAGYTASATEVDARLAMIKSQMPSEDAYKQVLQANGVSEERFKESLGKGIAVERYVREKLVPAIQITPDEVQAYYDGNKPLFAVPEQVHVRHILIKVEANAPAAAKEAARKKAEDLLKKVKEGGDFAQLAAANSDDQGSKARGGDLGYIPRGKSFPEFEKAAFALAKPGDVSPLVESQFGFQIIQLGDRKEPSVMQFDEVKERIGHVLQERKALESLRARVKTLRDGGKVKSYL